MTMKEMRKEYSELRSIARKRVERFGKGEFSWTQSYRKAFYEFHTRFRPVASLGNISKSDFAKLIRNLKGFVSNKEYSTRGLQNIRRKSLETLHSHRDAQGNKIYDFVTKENWRDWVEFIEWWKDEHPGIETSPIREEMRMYLDFIKSGMTHEEAQREFRKYEASKGR